MEEALRLPGWTIKYYKGLGTSDKKEAQEYFADYRRPPQELCAMRVCAVCLSLCCGKTCLPPTAGLPPMPTDGPQAGYTCAQLMLDVRGERLFKLLICRRLCTLLHEIRHS